MSATGICQICGQREAKHSCPNCGTITCEEDWDEEVSLCAKCAATVERGGDESGRVKPEGIDEDDVMRF